ncbi:MAG: sodium:calcium antiporter [Candidatus Micrarchaeota archaeon]
MLVDLALLVAALVVLAKSAEYAISRAVVLARFLRISEMAVGFLLVSTATSLPELAVAVTASASGETGISVGNVLGANIADLCLVAGAAALVGTIIVRRRDMSDLLKTLFAVGVLSMVVLFPLGRFAGVLLLLAFTAYAVLLLQRKVSEHMNGVQRITRKDALLATGGFAAGIAVVVVCANFVVSSAVTLAIDLGVSRAFVAGTIVSIGTTLPELVVSVAAARKKLPGIAIGNAVGSCIVNLTLVLGAAAAITPIQTNMFTFLNLAIFALVSNVVLWMMIRKGSLGKRDGMALIGIYVLFLVSALATELGT